MEENLIIDINNSKVYKCTEYKKINKCKSFIILNDKKEILKYNSSHNHPENEYDVSLSIMKHKIKDGIEKSSIPLKWDLYVQNIIQLNPKYQEI
ncbi:hypothetical protein H8356DRAFT_1300378 [Neocallimastix lanati (nom. inval.)]|nr:hypothetical protein H8356DRAFT_1300378 [Neocallimastix sp. JGI-2020a]